MKIEKNPATEVDVDRLAAVFSDLLPDGRVISHEQIEAALRESRLSSRYRRVVAQWRRRLFVERGIFLDGQAAHGRGLCALAPDDMVRYGNRAVRQAGRKIRKALAVASAPDDATLSEDVRRYRGLLAVALEKIGRENRSALRAVTRALAPQVQLPRRTIPEVEKKKTG